MLVSIETLLLMLLIVPLGPRRQLTFSMVGFPLDFYFRLLDGLQKKVFLFFLSPLSYFFLLLQAIAFFFLSFG